jgi:hypothetical protein
VGGTVQKALSQAGVAASVQASTSDADEGVAFGPNLAFEHELKGAAVDELDPNAAMGCVSVRGRFTLRGCRYAGMAASSRDGYDRPRREAQGREA